MKLKADFKEQTDSTYIKNNYWYDLEFDRDLIEASFAMQYGIRLDHGDGRDISFAEFLRLLKGILPDTPLGRVISIRREDDNRRLKEFSWDERKIRDEWRRFVRDRFISNSCVLDWDKQIDDLQDVLSKMFGA